MARRAAHLELADEHLEALQWARRQEELAAEHAEGECWALVAAQHPRAGHGVDLEQVGDRDTEGVGDPAQRCDARARLAALDLAQEALAETRTCRHGAKGAAARPTDRAKPLADVDLGGNVGGARWHQLSSPPSKKN